MDVVWEATVDDKYNVKVTRSGEYTGELIVAEQRRAFHSEPVNLSHGARFGPDAGDVAIWQDKILAVIGDPA